MPDDDDLLQPQQFDAETVADEEAVAEATPEPEAKDPPQDHPAAEEPKEQTVPLAALHSVREENKSLKAQLARLDRLEQHLMQQQQSKAPKFDEAPEAYFQSLAAQFAAREANITAEISERLARMQHGDDTVEQAFAAAEAAGALDQFKGKRDAWGDLVKWHKAQTALKEIGDDPAAYKERLEQQIRAELAAERAKNPANQPAPSLAGETNLGARTPPAWSGPTPLDEILGSTGTSF